MLDTFSFEPYFKSYCLFTFRSLKFWKLRLGPCLLPLSVSLLLTADSATPPAAALGRLPAPPPAPRGFHASPRNSPPPFAIALVPPPFATPPRRVQAAATANAAVDSPGENPDFAFSSRAPRLQERLFIPFPSPSRSFPAQTPRNAAAAPPNAGEPQARRRAAPPQPLRPNRPRQ